MKIVSKAILIALAALLVVAVAAVVGINLYVQSPGTQARIQEELSEALKLPLVITNTSLTPWSDLRINGISVPAAEGNFLEASSFSARYKLLPLLRKRLVIFDMRFEHPQILWAQNEKGRWVLPKLPKAPKEAASEKKAKKEKGKRDSDFEVSLEGFRITNGSVDFIDKKGRRVAQLAGVNMTYTVITEERIEGVATIARINYADALFFENVQTPFQFTDGAFEFPKIEATLAGGPVRGAFSLNPKQPKSPFAARLQFERVDVARLSTEAGWAPGRATGMLGGAFEMSGLSRDMELATGKGELTLTNGTLRQYDLLQTLGEVLQFEELVQLRIDSGVAQFRLGEEQIQLEQLTLVSPDIKLSATGSARLNGRLDLDARLAVDDRRLKRQPGFVRDLFAAADANGEHAIDFKVGGTLDKPKTDLAEKLLGRTLGEQFENVVSKLFGFGKKKEDDKKKDDKKKKKKSEDKTVPVPPEPASGSDLPSAPADRPTSLPSPAPTGPSAFVWMPAVGFSA